MKQTVKFKKLTPNAIVPTYGTEFSAGADLYSGMTEPVIINAGTTEFIKTGIAMEIPEGLVGLVYARSGMACKKGLAPANKVGVIDSDYRGELMVALHNHSQSPHFSYKKWLLVHVCAGIKEKIPLQASLREIFLLDSLV